MIRIGVTGGIASGKSDFSSFLKEEGVFVIDEDEIAHKVLERKDIISKLKNIFGPEVVNTQGKINRRYLAKKIFFDKGKRLQLNSLVHPLVREEILKRARQLSREKFVVFDVPLLWEARLVSEVDIVVWVKSPWRERLKRLEREGMSFSEALFRLRAGTPEKILMEIADYVVENDAGLDELRNKAKEFLRKLKESEIAQEQLGHA